MKRSVRIATVLLVLGMLFGNTLTAFASLGVNSSGKEALYIMEVSEAGSFDGNGQTIDICNCTQSTLDVYINDKKEYTLAANGEAGSILSYKTQKYSYVFSYTAESGKLDIYVGKKGTNKLGNTSMSTTSCAMAASAQAEADGNQEKASAYQEKAEQSMTTYMQNLADFENKGIKNDEAYIASGSNITKALSNAEIAEKFDEVCDDLGSSIE